MSNWLQELTVFDIFGVVGWIIGIVSGILGVKSYFDDKRFALGFKEVLEEAQKKAQVKITEEEITKLSSELNHLKNEIRKEIPLMARQVYYRNQIEEVKANISRSYIQFKDLSAKIDGNTANTISPEINRTIEEAILPNYVAQQRQNKITRKWIFFAIILLIFANWNFFMSIIHNDWYIHVNYWEFYPVSWIIAYIAITIILAFSFNKTVIGRWVKKFSTLLLKKPDLIKKKKLNFKESIGVSFQLLVRLSIVLLLITTILGIPNSYIEFTSDIAANSESSEMLPMPIEQVPNAILWSIIPSLVLLFFYNLLSSKRKFSQIKKSKGI